MTKATRWWGTLWVLVMLLTGLSGTVVAQEPTPPAQENLLPAQDGAQLDPRTNLWMSATDTPQLLGASPLSVGGPDDYGYTWDDSLPVAWIDATGGTNAGLSSNSSPATGAIGLPFSFKYYENSFSSVHITAYGYVSFDGVDGWPSQPQVPSRVEPNGIVAPYATPISLAASGPTNQVYYQSGGSVPNRYFVVEWYQVKFADEMFTFEVIFYENGDIVFQYQQMEYGSSHYCGASGIENATGLDGLAYQPFCLSLPSNKAVRFYRPAPAARVDAYPLYGGSFSKSGETVFFPMTVRNTGELGDDVYDLDVTSAWPVSVSYQESGIALVDTDSDGLIDTGSMAEGGSRTVLVSVQTPTVVNVGDSNTVSIEVTSSQDASRSKQVIYRTAIPASFAQVFEDDANGALSLDLVQPGSEEVKSVTGDDYFSDDLSVAEKADGFIYAWSRPGDNGNASYHDLEYTLLDHTGKVTHGVRKLTNNASATVDTYDSAPAIAVAPDGHIGLVWYRELYDNRTGDSQYNIFFAILDSSGNVVTGPTNLTNNSAWGSTSGLDYVALEAPDIAASEDSRFTIAWHRYDEGDGYIARIYYTVKDSNGGTIKSTAEFTSYIPSLSNYHADPILTSLPDNQVMILWTQLVGNSPRNGWARLDSSGNVVHGASELDWHGTNLDVTRLSTGSILIAGQYWGSSGCQIIFSVLSTMSGTTTTVLENPAAMGENGSVSVTADLSGHGILTWTDYDSVSPRHLYYALVDSEGNVVTPPMIFQSSRAADPSAIPTYERYGNTTNRSVVATAEDVDLRIDVGGLAGAPQGGQATIPVAVGNYGAAKATGVTLTAVLDASLAFVAAEPAPTSVVGNTVVWELADMDFLGNGRISLQVAVPATTVGALYPIQWSLDSAGPEANPADNTALTNVMEAIRQFLPNICTAK